MKTKCLRVRVEKDNCSWASVSVGPPEGSPLFVCKKWWKAAGGQIPRGGQTLEADVFVRPVKKRAKKHGGV